MFTNPHLMLDLHHARAADLHADAAHDRLVRALRRHASTGDPGRTRAPRAARGWLRRRAAWS
jgi:hypothetical protein